MSAVDRKARKPYWRSEKASDVKIFSQDSKDLTNNRQKAYMKILLSPSFLKTVTTDEDFQQEAKQDSAQHLLYNIAITGETSGEHIKDNGWNSVWASGLDASR